MNIQTFEFNPNSENLYEEIRELIHSQYVEHKGLLVFCLHSHSNIVRRLMYEAPITRLPAHSGADMYFYFEDKLTQSVELKTSDDLNTISLEVKTIE